jgi:hypothetical protein
MENKTAAVICEYNPFHYGHKYQLDKLHDLGYNVISIMSGNTVQRGDLALFEKYSRARTALQNGADIVVELPFPYSMTSAGDFAKSGVALAKGLGVDALAFGCESPELVFELARFLGDDSVKAELKTTIDREKNISMPKARQRIVEETLSEEYGDAITKQNNILAVEYIIACNGELELIPLLRDQTKLSATYLRSLEYDAMLENLPPMSDGIRIDSTMLDTTIKHIVYTISQSYLFRKRKSHTIPFLAKSYNKYSCAFLGHISIIIRLQYFILKRISKRCQCIVYYQK